MNERAIGSDQIGQRNFVIHGLFDDGRASSGKHKDDERSGVESIERFQNGICGLDGFRRGRWMSTLKISEAAHLARRLDRRSDDPLKSAADLIFERCDHGVSRFADGDYQYAGV